MMQHGTYLAAIEYEPDEDSFYGRAVNVLSGGFATKPGGGDRSPPPGSCFRRQGASAGLNSARNARNAAGWQIVECFSSGIGSECYRTLAALAGVATPAHRSRNCAAGAARGLSTEEITALTRGHE